MKHAEFKPCAICRKGVLHSGSPWFYRIRAEQMVADTRAIERAVGLEKMIGNAAIANAMGPDDDLAKGLGPVDLLVCAACALHERLPVALLVEDEESTDA